MNIVEKFTKAKQKERLEMLRIWDIEYYQNDNPTITDTEYDECLRIYNAAYKKPYTSALGKANDAFTKYTHTTPVLSLDKITEYADFEAAIAKFDYEVVIEPKLDGLTIVKYPDGSIVSRGNGEVGEVLPFAHKLNCIGETLDKAVRMEAVLEKAIRRTYFPELEKNSRNIVAGALRRKNESADLPFFSAWAYDILGADDMTPEEQLKKLDENGYSVPDYIVVHKGDDLAKIFAGLEEWSKTQPYETDGIVVKANVAKNVKDYGSTAHHPNNAFAFKFVSKVKETTLIEIEWSVGRNKLTPVAIFDPVELGDTTVSRASLHNLNIIEKLGVRIGSRVKVTKKNEIIPQIIEADGNGTDICPPDVCPSCGHKLFINDTKEVVCLNEECELYTIDTMCRLSGKDGLDIVGISEETVAKLFEYLKNDKFTGVRFNPFELLHLDKKELQEAGMTEYMSVKLSAEITKKSENVRPENFLTACNINGVGINTAKEIFKQYTDISDFLTNWSETGKNVNGIGDVIHASIDKELGYIAECAKYIVSFAGNKLFSDASVSVDAKTIVITGKLSKPKSFYEELIVNAGYNYSDTYTKATDYLVAADPNGSSSKLQKARKNGTSIISEAELLELVSK